MARSQATRDRSRVLLGAIGIDEGSFEEFLQWTLAEHLVSVISRDPMVRSDGFFARPDAMKVFRDTLRLRTRSTSATRSRTRST
jgi:hypothetical protein